LDRRDAPERVDVGGAAVGQGRFPQRDVGGASQHVGGDVGDLVIAEGGEDQDLVGLRAGQGVRREVVGVAVVLSPVPQHLDERQVELVGELVGVGGGEERVEVVEV